MFYFLQKRAESSLLQGLEFQTTHEYDLEARAEAMPFVLKNPVPTEGFQDFESEKIYARKIHDFIAKKVTYSPLGYAPELMIGLEK